MRMLVFNNFHHGLTSSTPVRPIRSTSSQTTIRAAIYANTMPSNDWAFLTDRTA